jgi:hypothetical protein
VNQLNTILESVEGILAGAEVDVLVNHIPDYLPRMEHSASGPGC